MARAEQAEKYTGKAEEVRTARAEQAELDRIVELAKI